MARVRIWRNARVAWEETQLPGNVARLLNTRGSAHIYGRKNTLWGVLGNFPEEITETSETPAAANFFNVKDDNEIELLNKTQAQVLYHKVAQLLFTRI